MDDRTIWVAVRLRDLKWHYCMKRLAYELVEELGADESVEMLPRHEGLIDLPGMVMTDRSYQDIRIDTFKLVIPTEDFEHFYDELRASEGRRFRSGEEYHKVHGWMACAMFTHEQRDMLVPAMESVLEQVREAARAEALEFSRRLAEARSRGARVVSAKELRHRGEN